MQQFSIDLKVHSTNSDSAMAALISSMWLCQLRNIRLQFSYFLQESVGSASHVLFDSHHVFA